MTENPNNTFSLDEADLQLVMLDDKLEAAVSPQKTLVFNNDEVVKISAELSHAKKIFGHIKLTIDTNSDCASFTSEDPNKIWNTTNKNALRKLSSTQEDLSWGVQKSPWRWRKVFDFVFLIIALFAVIVFGLFVYNGFYESIIMFLASIMVIFSNYWVMATRFKEETIEFQEFHDFEKEIDKTMNL